MSDELPPLPEPRDVGRIDEQFYEVALGYDAEQMQAYARTAVAAERAKWEREKAALHRVMTAMQLTIDAERAKHVVPTAEPVAWMVRFRGRFGHVDWTPWEASAGPERPDIEHAECETYPLYAHPPALADNTDDWESGRLGNSLETAQNVGPEEEALVQAAVQPTEPVAQLEGGPWIAEMFEESEPVAPDHWRIHGADDSYEATLCEFWSGEHDNEAAAKRVAELLNGRIDPPVKPTEPVADVIRKIEEWGNSRLDTPAEEMTRRWEVMFDAVNALAHPSVQPTADRWTSAKCALETCEPDQEHDPKCDKAPAPTSVPVYDEKGRLKDLTTVPTSGNDEVEAMCEELRYAFAQDNKDAWDKAAVFIRKQAAQIKEFQTALNVREDENDGLSGQIAELRAQLEQYRFKWAKEATAQSAASPTLAESSPQTDRR